VHGNSWKEIMRLAFRYLDNDSDGVLSPKDLVTHLVPSSADAAAHADAWSAAHLWVSRWCNHGRTSERNGTAGLYSVSSGGLSHANFRAALLASPKDSLNTLSDNMDFLGQDVWEGEPDLALHHSGSNTGREEELCSWGDLWARGKN